MRAFCVELNCSVEWVLAEASSADFVLEVVRHRDLEMMAAVRERLGDPTARGFGTPGANVDHKNLLHVTLQSFLLTDE